MKSHSVAEQQDDVSRVFGDMDSDDLGAGTAVGLPESAMPELDSGAGAEAAVTALYQASALSLIRLAYIMLGDLPSAEDVVQEAFYGLYRRWDRLKDHSGALYYVRASVLNGCRSVIRRRAVRRRGVTHQPPAVSAEAVVLSGEEREEVIRALTRLPHRQREVLVLRFYSELSDEEIALVMGIGQSTVRSAAYRALETLGRALTETP
ncbi:MAG TPA: SigE family RNA polymerase sigma factor [Streptosporangiaceae bacterium]|nr:SigE family RNA polymerase sigma factor [Streptosporangiaceae bacterium]